MGETIQVNGTNYEVRSSEGPNKKWVQTDKGEKLVVKKGDRWEWEAYR